MGADFTIFDRHKIRPAKEEVFHDFPKAARRIRAPAAGIKCTVVNGGVLLEDGEQSAGEFRWYPGA